MYRVTTLAVLSGFVIGLAIGCGSSRIPEVSGSGGEKPAAESATKDVAPDIKKGVKIRYHFMTGGEETHLIEEVRGHWIKIRERDVKEPYWVNTNSFSWYQIKGK
jgi:hypothetical protein